MRVFDITKEYAPAFADFIPDYVLAQIGVEGFHTIGEVATDGSDHYAAGLLQYYDGNFSDKMHFPTRAWIPLHGSRSSMPIRRNRTD